MPVELGAVIAGRYKLVSVIGEGGMGSVYRAEQLAPVRRPVALKLIKAGLDTKSVLARFDAERQALALMDHPSIARVYDGGTTETGQPFFVMELVAGVPLTDFCDERRLDLPARLRLLIAVCQAVQHAHQKGVIHRDLKPGNILVTEIDGVPTPKVIDFGVAKATEIALTDQTLGDVDDLVGTPAYMSPEQADPTTVDIDTRSDVYSLGVILYELLTGTPPIDITQLKRGALFEMLRMVREDEAPRPSTKVRTAAGLADLAAKRGTEPTKLPKLLQNDLDWIALKALEKDRERRYDTANGLARDLERYLADEMVEARAPSNAYRARKFLRRHKAQAIAAGIVFLSLVAGVIGTATGLVRAKRANIDLAAKNQELIDEQAKVDARFELARRAIAGFHSGQVGELLTSHLEWKELRTVLLTEAARFYGDMEKLLAKETDEKSRRLLATSYYELGTVTQRIGSASDALQSLRKALAILEPLAEADPEDVGVQSMLAECHLDIGLLLSGDEATAKLELALAMHRRLAEAHPEDYDLQRRLTVSMNEMAIHFMDADRLAESLAIFREALAIDLEYAEPDDAESQSQLARRIFNIASILERTGKPREAMAEYERSLAIRQQIVDANPEVERYRASLANRHSAIATVLVDLGEPVAAMASFERERVILQRLVDDSPAVSDFQDSLAECLQDIGELLLQSGKATDATVAYERAMAIRQKLVEENPSVPEYQAGFADSYGSLAAFLLQSGKPAEALAAIEKAEEIQQKLCEEDPATWRRGLVDYQTTAATILLRLGRSVEARSQCEQAQSVIERMVEEHPDITGLRAELMTALLCSGQIHRAASDDAAASADWRRAIEVFATLPAPSGRTMFDLACCHGSLAGVANGGGEQARDAEEAIVLLQRAVEMGFRNPAAFESETSLDPLRSRDDFQKLVGGL